MKLIKFIVEHDDSMIEVETDGKAVHVDSELHDPSDSLILAMKLLFHSIQQVVDLQINNKRQSRLATKIVEPQAQEVI